MLRDHLDKIPDSEVRFSGLPPSQTIEFVLSFLEQTLPIFVNAYVSAQHSLQEDEISKELLLFLQEKSKHNNLLIGFNGVIPINSV